MWAFLTHDPNKKDRVNVLFSSNVRLDEPVWPTPSLKEKKEKTGLHTVELSSGPVYLNTCLPRFELWGQMCKQEDGGKKIFNEVSIGNEAPDGEEMWTGYG